MSISSAMILLGGGGLLALLLGIHLGIEIGRDREWFNSTFTRNDTNGKTKPSRKRRRN
jgi:hypothetical protein